MKWFAVYAVLVSVAVSVTEAVVRGADQQNSVERKLQPNDYEPWEQDTAVYYEFEDGWYWGTITAYNDGEYTTVWSDDSEIIFEDLAAVDQMVEDADDNEPWEQGTVVYYEFEDGWYWGTITAHNNGEYTTTWSDDSVEVFSDDVVDQMVENAVDNGGGEAFQNGDGEGDQYQPWEQGTVVYYEFEDGWYWGTITAYGNGAYTTFWSDGDEEVFTDLAAVDQMVEDADDNSGGEAFQNGDGEGDQYQPWEQGTVLYYEWPSGWYWGTITAYENGAYTTIWSDVDEEVFTDLAAVDQMVQNADDNAWELGTEIYYQWPDVDGWWWGTITAYDNGVYTTTWSDKDEEVFTDLAIVNQMVEDASQARGADANPTNKKPAVIGRVILVLAVFAAAGAAAFFLERRQRQKRQETLEETVESISAQLETDLPFIT